MDYGESKPVWQRFSLSVGLTKWPKRVRQVAHDSRRKINKYKIILTHNISMTDGKPGGYHTLLQCRGGASSPALCTAARQSGQVEFTRNHASMHSAWNPCPQPGTSRAAGKPSSPSSVRHTAQSTFSAPKPAGVAATRTNTGSGDGVVVARGVRRAASPAP